MKLYILGPIHLSGEDYIPLYKRLIQVGKQYFDEVLAPYPDFWETGETPGAFYKRTVETVATSNLLLAEISKPSSGVGMELQMAEQFNVPCVGMCKKGNEPSKTVKGIPSLKEIIYYTNLDDLVEQVNEILKKYSH